MQHARERLYLTADKGQVVGEGHPAAAFLYAAQGDEIPASAAERFGIVDGAPPAKARRRHDMLLGSSILPAMVAITATLTLQLGEIVLAAQEASGLTVDDWNALPEAEREAKLQATVEALQLNPPATPKPKALAKPKAAAKKAAATKPDRPKEQPAPENKEQPAPDNKEEPAPENKGG